MPFKVLKYDVFCEGTVGRREVPAPPKPSAPVTLLELRARALDLMGRPAFHQSHQIADRKFGRDRYDHMNVVARQQTFDDLDAGLRTDLSADIPDAQLTFENFEAVLRRPDEVVSVIVHAMLAT